jgi:hypothetical protein
MAQEQARNWTAVILKDGRTLYAWMAWNAKLKEYATDRLEHARAFDTEENVETWIAGLKVQNATPTKLSNLRARKPANTGAKS